MDQWGGYHIYIYIHLLCKQPCLVPTSAAFRFVVLAFGGAYPWPGPGHGFRGPAAGAAAFSRDSGRDSSQRAQYG